MVTMYAKQHLWEGKIYILGRVSKVNHKAKKLLYLNTAKTKKVYCHYFIQQALCIIAKHAVSQENEKKNNKAKTCIYCMDSLFMCDLSCGQYYYDMLAQGNISKTEDGNVVPTRESNKSKTAIMQ